MKTKLLFLISTFCQLIIAQVSDQGLLAYYPFNGDGKNQLPGGSAFDLVSFGTGTDITYLTDTGFVSGEITNASCVLFNLGKAMVSEGISNYLNTATNKDLTISYWVNYSNAASMTNNNMHLEGFRSLFVSGRLAWGIRNTTWHTGSVNLSVSNNQWNHIAIVYNASQQTLRVYSNGFLIGTTNTSGNSINQITNKFVVGGGTDDSGNHMESKTFFGRIDEMYVFNRALGASEITALSLKERPKNPNPTITNENLIAYYPFNGNTQNAVPNGSAFDLTLFENNTPVPSYVVTGGVTGGQINNTGCYSFSGGVPFVTEGFGNLMNNNPNQNLSVSYWVNQTNLNNTNISTHIEFFASLFGRGASFNWGVSTSDGSFETSAFGLAYANSWAHITLVYNATDATIACYGNGNLLQSIKTTPQNSIFRYNNKTVIGGGTNSNGTINYSKSFRGWIDEMYVFNKALSPSEVLALFNKQVPTSVCPTGNVTLTTQAEVNAFVAQYPNCTQINGDLILNGDTINNISGLANITIINGHLIIQNTGLTNLNGIDNLNSIQRITITSNPFLTSIAQLSGINGALTGNMSITLNSNLATLNGLQNITQCVRLTISNNSALTDLTGLNGLTTLTSPFNTSISIDNNNNLTSLNGIQNLLNFPNNGGLFISDNPLLNNISAINSNANFGALTITNNNSLSSLSLK